MSFDVFEVQVSDGRRWGLVQKFAGSERDEAIAHANALFASQSHQAVRVVRETFDQANQVFKHQTILRHAKPTEPVKRLAVELRDPPPRRTPPPTPAAAPTQAARTAESRAAGRTASPSSVNGSSMSRAAKS